MSRQTPAARVRDGAVLALAVLALAACSGPSPGDSAPPTPSASPTPSVSPTPSETAPEPAATAAATATPSVAPSPAPEAARYCGDRFILDRPHLVWWEGTEAEQLAAAEAKPAFEPPEVLEGLDVICVSTFSNPLDDPRGGIVRIAEALVDRDDAAFDRLEAWAAASGYQPVSEGPGYVEHAPPADPDGSQRVLFWAPLDSTQPMLGNAETIMRHTGADADDILVTHSVTKPN